MLGYLRQLIPKRLLGGVAQLGEHLLCKQGVMGSSPIISTRGMGDGTASCIGS